MNNQLTIAFTGHRPNKLGNEYNGIGAISNAIRKDIQYMIDQYDIQGIKLSFICGGALGIDMLAEETAIVNKIPLLIAIPCLNQEAMWPQSSKDRYHRILNWSKDHTDKQGNKLPNWSLVEHIYVSNQSYSHECMQLRNVYMIDNSARLRAYWDGTNGGTKNCVTYAKSISRPIDTINPFSLIERV